MELVRQKSNEKKNICRSVISFSPDNASTKLGEPITKEAWQELVKQNIEIIAKENNIKMSNMRWVAAAHDTPFAQLESKYDEKVAKTIKGNCQVWDYLQSDDQETLREISDKTGKVYCVNIFFIVSK